MNGDELGFGDRLGTTGNGRTGLGILSDVF